MNGTGIPAVYMRGGTSKGVFLHARDIPAPGEQRDALLLSIMGSPDPMQIDGMGGTYSSTSKVVVVETDPDGVVVYWFAQIGVDTRIVDWSGNCGNLTTAVAPFAVDEGLVTPADGVVSVRLRNGNTGVAIDTELEVRDGRAVSTGPLAIAGVPGTGAPVTTKYIDPAGGVLGTLLPTGAAAQRLRAEGRTVTVSIVDAAHPYVFVSAAELGLAPDDGRTSADLNTDASLLERVEDVRSAAAVAVGVVAHEQDAFSKAPATPRIVLVGPGAGGADVRVTAFSMGRVHRALPMTAALCLAAAAATPGTIVADLVGRDARMLRVRHPLGVAEVTAEVQSGPRPIRSLGIVRTARRLMEGRVFPRDYE